MLEGSCGPRKCGSGAPAVASAVRAVARWVLCLLCVTVAAAPALAGKGMYISIGKDGTPVVTDYPHADAVHYKPGDFDKLAMRQKGVPHRGLRFDDDFGGPPTVIEIHEGHAKQPPAPPALIDRLIASASAKFGVPAALVRAVVAVESAFKSDAVSHAGALGLMQLMPDTAADLGVKNAFDPEENINGGTRYLAFLLKHFKSEELAVAAYNAGPGRVAREGGVPDIPETRAYVESVLGLRQAYEGMLR